MKLFIFLELINIVSSFTLSSFEPTIGKWKFLYTTNTDLTNRNFDIQISPSNEDINDMVVKIKIYESLNILKYTKIINCNVMHGLPKQYYTLNECLLFPEDGEICSLLILKAEKIFKSIGIFEFPYFTINYTSGMNPKYIITWKVDYLLNRLYINIETDTYIFEKKNNDYIDSHNEESVTTNVFLITNLLSFFFGKLLEKTIHMN